LATLKEAERSVKRLSIIAPVYNEEAVIEEFYTTLRAVLDGLAERYTATILFVVDRSADRTEEILAAISARDPRVQCLFLSSRFGHQMSLLAGMDHCDADAVVMMDSDLQHPPEAIPALLEKYEEGFDVVYTIREEDKTSGIVGRLGSRAFYWLIDKLSPVKIRENAADFRLISRRVLRIFQRDIREQNQFLRGLFSWVGFRSTGVSFQCKPRAGGSSKYTTRRRMQFAAHGIVSFSRRPLQLAFYMGIVTAFGSLLLAGFTLLNFIVYGAAVPGWTTLAILVPLLSGVQLVFLGIMGEYIGAIFEESKARPHYLVDRRINLPETDDD